MYTHVHVDQYVFKYKLKPSYSQNPLSVIYRVLRDQTTMYAFISYKIEPWLACCLTWQNLWNSLESFW